MIVVDASVLANAVGDDGSDGSDARRELRRARDAAVPFLADIEVVSVLRKRWLSGDLTDERFADAVEALVNLSVARHSMVPLLHRIYELRANVTPYDAAYVALAESLDCPLLTNDRRLAGASGPQCEIRVVTP
ncbi:MAG: type II toxin-antitoxin system VapC family toxin [bacterium]|nr:type II toxin-antitoxin system VapC family toxin [bacterium]